MAAARVTEPPRSNGQQDRATSALTWDKLALRRPASLTFRLIPSERLLRSPASSRRSTTSVHKPLHYLTPSLALTSPTLQASQAPLLRLIDPTPFSQPFISLSSLCLLPSPPTSPLRVLLALDLRRGHHWETGLLGAEPLEPGEVKAGGEVWLRLSAAREVARLLDVEREAEALLSESKAWSLDEGANEQMVHNWLPANPTLAAASLSTSTLLSHDFSALSLIKAKNVGEAATYSTLISEEQRRELTEQWLEEASKGGGWRDIRRRLMKWTIELVERVQDGEEEEEEELDHGDVRTRNVAHAHAQEERQERILELLVPLVNGEGQAAQLAEVSPLDQLLSGAAPSLQKEAHRLEMLWRLVEGTCALQVRLRASAPTASAPTASALAEAGVADLRGHDHTVGIEAASSQGQPEKVSPPSTTPQTVAEELLAGQRRIEELLKDLTPPMPPTSAIKGSEKGSSLPASSISGPAQIPPQFLHVSVPLLPPASISGIDASIKLDIHLGDGGRAFVFALTIIALTIALLHPQGGGLMVT